MVRPPTSETVKVTRHETKHYAGDGFRNVKVSTNGNFEGHVLLRSVQDSKTGEFAPWKVDGSVSINGQGRSFVTANAAWLDEFIAILTELRDVALSVGKDET